MAADRDDEPGVLGNLPRSRPGRRSDKRATGAAAPKRAPAKKRATGSASSTASPAASRGSTSSSQRGKGAATPPPRPQAKTQARPKASPSSAGDPIAQAVQIAGKVAAVGVKTAAGIIRRLPGR